MSNRRIIVAILILLFLSWGIVLFLYIDFKNRNSFHGKLYNHQAPRFTLTGHSGQKVRLDQFQDKIVLIAWGYTNCPDICPITLANLKEVMDLIGEDSKQVQVLYISVDPTRDTPEKLSSYVPYFHKDFIGLTGSPEEISDVADDYSVTIVKHPEVYGLGRDDPWDRYLMTHTNTIHLIDQSGRLYITYPHHIQNSQEMAKDIQKLLR
ncbi:MAG: SCO family protein [Thermodesulfobacteriota bacterium]